MWTGRQTLATIEQAIARLNAQEGELDAALRTSAAEAERLRRERAAILRELARFKLGEMEAGRLIRDLDVGERRALQILAERRDRLTALAEQRKLAVAELEQAEADRHDAAAKVEIALDAVTEKRNEVEARLATAPQWTSAKADFDTADTIARKAEEKADQSEDELTGKRKPYDNDPLFIYLWHRGFGTQAYQAGNIVRFMDRQVSDFIGFLDARPNYAMLVEIPRRLREHATDRRDVADARHQALAELEQQAMRAAGVDDLERTLAEARHRLALADEATEDKRARLQKLDDQRDALQSTTENEAYNQAIEAMVGNDSTDTIATLLAEARRTHASDDERLVRALERLDESIAQADREAADLRQSAKTLTERRIEVERARSRMRSSGYDHPDVVFGNDNQISDAIEQIARGVIRSGILWDLLRAGYGTRSRRYNRRFGNPSLPFPFPLPGPSDDGPRGGGWREPSSSGGWEPDWGGGGSNDSSGGSDDDFRTGGSF